MTVKLMQVIFTDVGRKDDPHRPVLQYWTTDGELLAEVDTYKPEHPEVSEKQFKRGGLYAIEMIRKAFAAAGFEGNEVQGVLFDRVQMEFE